MDRIRLKPAWSKIIVFSLIFALVEFFLVLLIGKGEFLQYSSTTILTGLILLLIQSFLFCGIFLHLPHFIIEVSNGHLIGPSLLGIGWNRVFIPIEEIDLRATNTSFQWLGFYVIKSRQGDKILVWAFDINQFEKLLIGLQQGKAQ